MVTCSRPDLPASALKLSRLYCTPVRERLSKMWMFASVFRRSQWAQLDPMNPAPPKIRTFRRCEMVFIGFPNSLASNCQPVFVQLLNHLRRTIFCMLLAQPIRIFLHALRKTNHGLITQHTIRRAYISKAVADIPGAIFLRDLRV